MRTPALVRTLLAGVVLATAVACPAPDIEIDPPPPTPRPAPEGTVRLGYPAEPPTLNPIAPGGGAATTRDILRPVLPALFAVGPDLRPVPELAAAWPGPGDITLDPFTVTLGLRRAFWSDGLRITADDVRFSWERLREGPTGERYRSLRDVEVIDDRNLRLHFDRPERRWWSLFSVDDMVLPAHAFSDEWDVGPTVSGGPFRYDGRVPGLSIRLTRNDAYWGERALSEAIDVLFVPDEETRLNLLEDGELDVITADGESNIGYRSRFRGWEEVEGPLADGGVSRAWAPAWWEIVFAPEHHGGAVAAATMHALDRNLIAELLEDSGQVMDGIPARFPAPAPREEGLPALAGPWPEADPDAARRILADAGFRPRLDTVVDRAGEPVEFLLAYAQGSSASAGIARVVHYALREVGVRVEVAGIEPKTFESRWVPEERADAYLVLRRGADAPEPSAYLDVAREAVDAAATSVSRRRLVAEPVVGLGAGGWEEAQATLVGQAAVIPLARVRAWLIARPGVAGPQAVGSAAGPLWNAASWRVAAAA